MSSIQSYRDQIDRLDAEILELIAQRFDISEMLGLEKKSQKMMPLQSDRWQEVVQNIKEVADEVGLYDDMVERMWDVIHEYTLKQHRRIIGVKTNS